MEKEFKKKVSELPPDLRVLLWAVRMDEAFSTDAAKLFHINMDWKKLMVTSFTMGVFPILYKRLKSLETGIVPGNIIRSFSNLYLSGVGDNLKLSNELIMLQDLFKKEGISILPFKGPVLAVQAYNDNAMRQSTDLDIMILNRDFNKVWEILSDNNFIPNFSPKTRNYIGRTWRDFNMSRGNLNLDIHRQVAKGPAFFRLKPEMWESAAAIQLNNKNVTTFSLADTLVFLCIHCAKDGFASLKRFRDIAGIIHFQPGLDWDEVYYRASAMKSIRILEVGLRMSKQLCGFKLPHFIVNRVSSNEPVNSIFHFFLNRFLSNKCDLHILTNYLTIPKALDTTWSKLKYYTWFAVTPSPKLHRPLFNLPPSFYFLFPVIHPFYLLFKYGGKFLRRKQTEKTSFR